MSDAVIQAIITLIGGTFIGCSFALAQFLIKLKFEKKVHEDERADKKDERFDNLRKEFQKGLDEREATGKERFDINSELIEENSKAIEQLIAMNKAQGIKLDRFADSVAKSFNSINENSKFMSEGVKSVLYDKIKVVYDKCLTRCDGGAITSEEEANIEQLYLSYSGLGGNGEGKTMYKKACEMKTVTDDEATRLDAEKIKKFT